MPAARPARFIARASSATQRGKTNGIRPLKCEPLRNAVQRTAVTNGEPYELRQRRRQAAQKNVLRSYVSMNRQGVGGVITSSVQRAEIA